MSLPKKFSAMLPDAFARMDRRAAGLEKPIPMPPKWQPLAEQYDGGWWQGTYILVGNTGTGKTQFALEAGLHAALKGTPVLYIGLELDSTQLVARLLGLHSKVLWSDLYLGRHHGAPLKQAYANIYNYADLPFYLQIADRGGWNFEQLSESVDYIRKIHPDSAEKTTPMLVILDFLQLVESRQVDLDLRRRIKGASYESVYAANQFNAAIVLLSSTAREHYATLDDRYRTFSNKAVLRPLEGPAARMVGFGKESGDVEYSATNLMVMCYNDGFEMENITPGGQYAMALAKVRTGVSKWLPYGFSPQIGSFDFTDKGDFDILKIARQVRKKKKEEAEE